MSYSSFKRRSKFRWIILALVFSGILLFHKALILVGVQAALNKGFSKGQLEYQALFWKESSLCIDALHIKDSTYEVSIDSVKIDFSFDWRHLYLESQVSLSHPQVVFTDHSAREESSFFSLILETAVGDGKVMQDFESEPFPIGGAHSLTVKGPSIGRGSGSKDCVNLPSPTAVSRLILSQSKHFGLKWEMSHGVMQLPLAPRIYFSLTPGVTRQDIGSFSLSYDPNPLVEPILFVDLHTDENVLNYAFKIQENDCGRIAPFLSFFIPNMQSGGFKTSGEIDLKGQGTLKLAGGIDALSCEGSLSNFTLRYLENHLTVALDRMEGYFTYSGEENGEVFWERLISDVSLQGGSMALRGAWEIKGIEATCRLEKDQDPKMILDGVIIENGQLFPIHVSGKGRVEKEGVFWIEMGVECLARKEKKMQAIVSCCSPEKEHTIWQFSCERAHAEHIELARKLFLNTDFQCVEGTAQGKCTWVIEKNRIERFSIDDFAADHMRLYFPKKEITFFADSLTGDLCLKSKALGYEIVHSRLKTQGGDLLFSLGEDRLYSATELQVLLEMQEDQIQHSSLQGYFNGVFGQIDYTGKEGLNANFQGTLDQYVSIAEPKLSQKFSSEPCQLTGSLIPNERGFEWLGKLESGQESIEFGVEIEAATHHILSFQDWIFKEAWARTEKISEKIYGPLQKNFVPDVVLQGDLDLFARLTQDSVHISVLGKDLILDHPWVSVTKAKTDRAIFSYDFKKSTWAGEIPLTNASVCLKENNLILDHIDTIFHLDQGVLVTDFFQAFCEGLAIQGDLSLSSTDLILTTSSIEGTLPQVIQVMTHFPELPQLNIPIQGELMSRDGGLILHTSLKGNQAQTEWAFKGDFSEMTFPINAKSGLEKLSCHMSFDSKEEKLVLEQFQGNLAMADGSFFRIRIDTLAFDPKQPTLFDLRIAQEKKEIGRLKGSVAQDPTHQWNLSFEPSATHFFGSPLQIEKLILAPDGTCVALNMKALLKCRECISQIQFLDRVGFLSLGTFSTDQIADLELQGDLALAVSLDQLSQKLTFSAESRNLKMKGHPITHLVIKGQRIADRWVIDRFFIDPIDLKMVFVQGPQGYSVSGLEGKWGKMCVQGKGLYRTDLKRFDFQLESIRGELNDLISIGVLPSSTPLQGTFQGTLKGEWETTFCTLKGDASFSLESFCPLPIGVKTDAKVPFTYSLLNGLHAKSLSLQVYAKQTFKKLGAITIGELMQLGSGAPTLFKQCSFSAASSLIRDLSTAHCLPKAVSDFQFETALEGSGDLTLSVKGMSFQGALKDGRYGFNHQMFPLEKISLVYEDAIFNCRFKALLGEKPIWTQLHIDTATTYCGILKVSESPNSQGIKALFKITDSGVNWESLQGSALGLQLNLTKSATKKVPQSSALTGAVKLDGLTCAAYLPKEIQAALSALSLGQGYTFQGDIVVSERPKGGFQLNGKVHGDHFDLLGYQFDKMEMHLDANAEHVYLINLQIDDSAVLFSTKKIAIDKNPVDGKWSFSIPLLQVKELKPSALKKIIASSQKIKPFVIKNGSLSQISGVLSDQSTWEGKGSLHFVNMFKKETTFLDLPIDMLKNLGLDLGILTPVIGEVELELRGDKFYLISLKNAFSEGNRSQFFLSQEAQTSYIDLKGKILIDIKMRQDVVLKLTEAFTLTIRGTLDKPKYGLQ